MSRTSFQTQIAFNSIEIPTMLVGSTIVVTFIIEIPITSIDEKIFGNPTTQTPYVSKGIIVIAIMAFHS